MPAARTAREAGNSSSLLGLSAEQILESVSDAFVALDRDWNLTYFNAAAERINGASRESVLGRNHWEVYPSSVGTPLEQKLRQVMETRLPIRFENYYEPWQRWFEVHAYPLATGGIGLDYRDISDRKQAEAQSREIAEANAKFRALFDQASQFTGILSLEGIVLEANESSLDIAAVDRGEVIGRPFWECAWWKNVPRLQDMVRSACRKAAEGEAFRTDSDYLAAGGKKRFVDLMIAPITNAEGRVVFLAATGTDITDRKLAERRHRLLSTVSEQTQPLVDPNEMTAVAARLLAEELDADRCAYASVEDESVFVITGNYTRGVHSIVGRWPVKAFGHSCVTSMRASEPYVVTDSENDPRISADDVKTFRAGAIRSVICVPLHKNGRFTAAMAVHQSRVREWTPDEIDLVRTVVALCWESLERAQALRGLDDALNAGTIGTFHWDVQRDRIRGDRNFARMFGFDGDSVQHGVPLEAAMGVIHPDDRLRVSDLIEDAVTNRGQYETDYRITVNDEVRWLEVRGRVDAGLDGSAADFSGVIADITDRKRAEIELARVSENSERQRRLYDAVLSNMADLAYVFDLNHRFVYANDVLLRMWGRTAAEAIGKNCLELGYEPWHAEMHDREIEQVIATKQPIRGEVPFTGTFGRRVYDYIFVPIFNEQGDVEAVAGTTRDVTDRKLYEEQLAQNERRFRELADASPAMLWLTDADGRCTFLSKQWYEYTGQTVEEALGFGWTTACHPDDTAQAGRELMAASNAHQPFFLEYRLRGRDGVYRWAMDIGRPRFSTSGEFLGLVGTVIEIDDRKQAEEALKLADRRKDEFLATLAHELRNPLAPLSNALEVWPLMEPGSEDADELRAMMQRQVRQMIRLIDDLLDVSRITRGKVELRRESIDLNTVIEGAIEAIQPFIDSCRHELAVVLPAHPVTVQGDVGRLVQVFGNLLHNAAKYTGQNGHLWVTATIEESQAVVRVRDNGPGIPPEMLTGIFEMFRQVDQTLDRAHGGLGIGLTLAKTLVEMHGGSIEARSEGPGRGSEFIVKLPMEAASLPSVERSGGFSFRRHLRPQHLRVLVVDDVVPSAKTLGLMLSGLGQKTRVEHNGPSALAAVKAFQPEVVFLDIAMPGMDGYEVARRIRRLDGPQPVLVALTGYGQDEDRKRAAEAGFDHHLVKPTSIDHLREVLMTVPRQPLPADS